MEEVGIRTLIALLLIFAMSSPAYAGWDRTRWGMSEHQIQAVYPEAIIDREEYYLPHLVLDLPSSYRNVLRLGNSNFGGILWQTVTLRFVENRLSEVELIANGECDWLLEHIHDWLGDRQIVQTDSCQGLDYADPERNNRITISASGNRKAVTFRPYEAI